MFHRYNHFDDSQGGGLFSPIVILLLWIISIIVTTLCFHWQQPFYLLLWLVGLWSIWLALLYYSVTFKRGVIPTIRWYGLAVLLRGVYWR